VKTRQNRVKVLNLKQDSMKPINFCTIFKNTTESMLVALVTLLALAGCTSLTQNVQQGNPTGNLTDNKWDYYNGTPIHYTSFSRGLYKKALTVRQETTDAFSAVFNAEKGRESATVDFNRRVIILKKFDDENAIDELIERTFGKSADKKKYKAWDVWYKSDDGKVHLAVNYKKQIYVTSYEEGDEIQQIAFYPSRYLACQKISKISGEKNQALVNSLLKTALVAGVQSYTSYSTTTYAGNYGNFGYAKTRDYSWAGDRSSDALDALFAGDGSSESIQRAWSGLNCW